MAPLAAGCAPTARIAVSAPRAAFDPGAADKAVFLSANGPGRDASFRQAVLGGLVRTFLATGRYTALSIEPGRPVVRLTHDGLETLAVAGADRIVVYQRRLSLREDRPLLDTARELTAGSGAQALVVLRAASVSVERQVHHVRTYFDGSASGEAAMIDPRSGAVLELARESVTASARARYATEAHIREHLASRLAEKLARGLLYERRAVLVDLEDPPGGALRRGIDLARRGEWAAASRSWAEALAAGRHPAAAHYNLAQAATVLGDPDAAREHLEEARRLRKGIE